MNDYICALALSYFKEKKEKYSFNELMELLGYTNKQLEELISNLISSKLVAYVNNLIQITPKGMTCLIANNQNEINIQDREYQIIHINPESALPLESPYVPKKFTKKYNG